jgi:hypothetical protein
MLRAALVSLLLLVPLPQEDQGVILFKDGRRVYGNIETAPGYVTVNRPFGQEGQWHISLDDILYFSETSTIIPQEYLGGSDYQPEDIELLEWDKEYRRLEKEMKKVIGRTRQAAASRERKRQDLLLSSETFSSRRLSFSVRPPRGWQIQKEEDRGLVMFIGPKRTEIPVQPRIHMISTQAPEGTFEELYTSYVEDLKEYHGDKMSFADLGAESFVDQDQWQGSSLVKKGETTTYSLRNLVKMKNRGWLYLLVLYTDTQDEDRNLEIFRYWKDSLSLKAF